MADVTVLAFHAEFGRLCNDARLGGTKDDRGLKYPEGDKTGQAGWNTAFQYVSLADLADKLEEGLEPSCDNVFYSCGKIQHGDIIRLGILTPHAMPGAIYINGQNEAPMKTSDIDGAHDWLHRIGLFTREGSTILFLECNAGQGAEGTAFLTKLSHIWPKRRVVAFSTMGYRHGGLMFRTGKQCLEPGTRQTDNGNSTMPDPYYAEKYLRQWGDLDKMPWQSEYSPRAKIVSSDKGIEHCPIDDAACIDSKKPPISVTKAGTQTGKRKHPGLPGPPRPASRNGKHH